jgi:nitronate monooxygenase
MSLPASLSNKLALPAVAAPMFLVSGPDLVVEACRAGVIGTFPALNQRTSEGYEAWLCEIRQRLEHIDAAPFGVNLIVHKTNPRLEQDLAITVKHKVPLVITSMGAVKDLVDVIHSYGGIVFHDIIQMHHARKAAEAGVDGLITVCAGAGGHAGTLNPFAFLAEVRAFFNKTVILSGCITNGREIAAARLLGADLAYLGTRFIATRESRAPQEYKEMLVSASAKDVFYTSAISGVHANFLRPSVVAAGIDPDNLPTNVKMDFGAEHEARVWRDVWSAGQGVGDIHDIPSTADLCARLTREYHQALDSCRRPSLDDGQFQMAGMR